MKRFLFLVPLLPARIFNNSWKLKQTLFYDGGNFPSIVKLRDEFYRSDIKPQEEKIFP